MEKVDFLTGGYTWENHLGRSFSIPHFFVFFCIFIENGGWKEE